MSNADSPSPDPGLALKVAINFVKQYYKFLVTNPEMLEKFYSPPTQHASYLSHGEGSEPTEPASLADTSNQQDRWGNDHGAGETMSFEFEDGAIDAQPSQNEGILMVVTASVIFTSVSHTERRKKFVQTFVLAKIGRNFAVINDILRFLAVTEVAVSVPVAVEPEAVPVSTPVATPEPEPEPEKAAPVVVASTKRATTEPPKAKANANANAKAKAPVVEKKASEDESSAPGGGVEESKVEAPEEEEAAVAAASKAADAKKRSSSKENKGKKNKGGNKQAQQQSQSQPAPAPVSKPPPGSWASLVVSGGSAPNTPSRAKSQEKKAPNSKVVSSANVNANANAKQAPLPPSDDSKDNGATADAQKKTQEKDKATPTATKTNGNAKTNNHKTKNDKDRSKRDPDNTLVIKNLSENIKEHDILNMFSPFATSTKSKIVGTNLNHHRLLAFVDYDSVAPVMAALKKHKETPFEWNGKVLEVDQKTLEQKARRIAGGNNGNQNKSNGYRNNNAGGAGRGGGGKYNNNNNSNNSNSNSSNNTNGRGDGGDRGGRRRGTRAGR